MLSADIMTNIEDVQSACHFLFQQKIQWLISMFNHSIWISIIAKHRRWLVIVKL